MSKLHAFSQFVKDEMRRRDMSARQFAEFVDVAPTTITRAIDEKAPSTPGIDFIIKLANATHVSVTALVEMAYPDVAESTSPHASTRILAQQIEQLPDGLRQAVEAIVRGARMTT